MAGMRHEEYIYKKNGMLSKLLKLYIRQDLHMAAKILGILFP